MMFGACVFVVFFQAEDGIRDYKVTGVQTCALPISSRAGHWLSCPAWGKTSSPGLPPVTAPGMHPRVCWLPGVSAVARHSIAVERECQVHRVAGPRGGGDGVRQVLGGPDVPGAGGDLPCQWCDAAGPARADLPVLGVIDLHDRAVPGVLVHAEAGISGPGAEHRAHGRRTASQAAQVPCRQGGGPGHEATLASAVTNGRAAPTVPIPVGRSYPGRACQPGMPGIESLPRVTSSRRSAVPCRVYSAGPSSPSRCPAACAASAVRPANGAVLMLVPCDWPHPPGAVACW